MQNGAEATTGLDFNQRPFITIWEAPQACDLACVHCRASAQPLRSWWELSTGEAQNLIDQIAEMQVPILVISGGSHEQTYLATRENEIVTLSGPRALYRVAIKFARACGSRVAQYDTATDEIAKRGACEDVRREVGILESS